jgi:Mg2+ and Co2+ transporter CorA
MDKVDIYSAISRTYIKIKINNSDNIEENYEYLNFISKLKINSTNKNFQKRDNDLIFIHLHNNPDIFESTLHFLDKCKNIKKVPSNLKNNLNLNRTRDFSTGRTNEIYKIILNSKKLDLDYILPIDEHSFFLNLNIIQTKNLNRRDVTSRRDMINFNSAKSSDHDLLIKNQIQLFILGNFYFILSEGLESSNPNDDIEAVSALDDLILYIFSEKFIFTREENIEDFIISHFGKENYDLCIKEEEEINTELNHNNRSCDFNSDRINIDIDKQSNLKLVKLKTQTNFIKRLGTWNQSNNVLNFELTSFHQYELDTRTKSSKNLIKKLRNLMIQESQESDSENEIEKEKNKIENKFNLNLNLLTHQRRFKTNTNITFKLEGFFYWLFLSSLENFSKISDYMNRECEELKETYLHLQKSFEKTKFYSRMSRLEETVHLVSQELKIKQDFFTELLKKLNRKEDQLVKILSSNLSQFKDTIKFAKNLKLYLEQMTGKMRETKITIKNLETTLQMIKKTFRIIIDDNQRKADEKMNKYMMYLTVLTGLLIPLQGIYQLFAMNIPFPFDKEKYGVLPFMVILGCSLIVFLGQFLILFCWKWRI